MEAGKQDKKLEWGKILLGCLAPVLVACISGVVALVTNWDKVESILGRFSTSDTILKEEFTDPASGWDIYSDELGNSVAYKDSAYRIFVNEPDIYLFGSPGISVRDSVIKFSTTYMAGPEDNVFGVACRYQDVDNYYQLVISTDGYYGIAKRVGGELIWLNDEKMVQSDYIHTGAYTNQITALCDGDRLGLNVNGHKLAEVKDSDINGPGDIALMAGSFAETGVDISFDHLVVSKP